MGGVALKTQIANRMTLQTDDLANTPSSDAMQGKRLEQGRAMLKYRRNVSKQMLSRIPPQQDQSMSASCLSSTLVYLYFPARLLGVPLPPYPPTFKGGHATKTTRTSTDYPGPPSVYLPSTTPLGGRFGRR